MYDLDSDNDTISDLVESGNDATDIDNDGVADGVDADGDGIVDSLDGNPSVYGDAADSAPTDTGGDGTPDYIDTDSNNDGTFDIDGNGHGGLDLDNDGMVDTISDPDGDGIMNAGTLDTKPGEFGGLPNLSTLPIVLENFNAVLINNNAVRINWTTSSEQNIQHFIIERSADGQHFTALGNVIPGTNGNQRKEYQADDIAPLPGSSYYRLRIVEYDNTTRLSNIARINRSGESQSKLLPTIIARGGEIKLYLSQQVKAGDKISVYDVNGQLLKTLSATGSSIMALSTHNLTPGVYWLKISTRTEQHNTLKFIVH